MPWLTASGTVYGKRYYTIAPPMWKSDWPAMELWCRETFGPTGSLWKERKNLAPEPNQRWYANNSKFWFLDEKDLNWFVLRWSE
jgi:hypothetical protein